MNYVYRQVYNIRRTKSVNLNVSCVVLQLPLHILLKPGVKSRMKMKLEQRPQVTLQLHLNYIEFYHLLMCLILEICTVYSYSYILINNKHSQ